MRRIKLFTLLLLLGSLACSITNTPVPISTMDLNQLPTIVVLTAQALALSATATSTNIPTETQTITPSPTSTVTDTATPTFTLTPSVTYTAATTPPAAVTIIYVYITNTFPPATKTFIPVTSIKATSTNFVIQKTSTSSPVTAPPSVPPEKSTGTPPIMTVTITPSPTRTNTPVKITCPESNTPFEARVIELINAERAKAGLSALAYQSQLTAAAQLHSADMACNNYFSHTGLDGSSFSERATRQGYPMGAGAENIAAGYSTPKDVVQGWMNSSGHKENILGNYTEIGIGYAYNKTGSYGIYWTAVFGSPK